MTNTRKHLRAISAVSGIATGILLVAFFPVILEILFFAGLGFIFYGLVYNLVNPKESTADDHYQGY